MSASAISCPAVTGVPESARVPVARSRKRNDLYAFERVAGVGVQEIEVCRGERAGRVLVRRDRPVRRRGKGCWPPPRRPPSPSLVSVSGLLASSVKAHPHLDRRALVGRHQRVGARRRPGDVRLGAAVHPDPLVRVADAGQPVGIHDGGGNRRQRLPDLRRAGDRRRARRRGVGRRRDGRRRRRWVSVSALLA